eukprot:TRINITY_DN6884_c0_g1_i1.p1 TRINITY_DN6884_c0_g1~~TRINITY_DN6884_c0_g1_i1.p1  ORF type:complete len:408 (+),score=47.72 TRINITY_DN6884_c0_g1_i1:84-1307(+)
MQKMRQRVRVACERCYQNKLACSETRPCPRCVRADCVCTERQRQPRSALRVKLGARRQLNAPSGHVLDAILHGALETVNTQSVPLMSTYSSTDQDISNEISQLNDVLLLLDQIIAACRKPFDPALPQPVHAFRLTLAEFRKPLFTQRPSDQYLNVVRTFRRRGEAVVQAGLPIDQYSVERVANSVLVPDHDPQPACRGPLPIDDLQFAAAYRTQVHHTRSARSYVNAAMADLFGYDSIDEMQEDFNVRPQVLWYLHVLYEDYANAVGTHVGCFFTPTQINTISYPMRILNRRGEIIPLFGMMQVSFNPDGSPFTQAIQLHRRDSPLLASLIEQHASQELRTPEDRRSSEEISPRPVTSPHSSAPTTGLCSDEDSSVFMPLEELLYDSYHDLVLPLDYSDALAGPVVL